jgi:histone H3/H4
MNISFLLTLIANEMTRLKSFGNLSRAPNAAATGALKTPRKLGHADVAPKSILKKSKAGAPVQRSIKKHKKRQVVVQDRLEEDDDDDEEDGEFVDEEAGATAASAAAETQESHSGADVVHDDDDDDEEEDEQLAESNEGEDVHHENVDATKPRKPRKVNYDDRRLRRIAILQKSEARLATKKGFKRIVNHIMSTSETRSLKGMARFTKDALQNLQAAVESLLHKVLSNTAQQVYTITNRNARIDVRPISVTAEQCLLSMKGAQFMNDYRDARQM